MRTSSPGTKFKNWTQVESYSYRHEQIDDARLLSLLRSQVAVFRPLQRKKIRVRMV